MEFANYSMWTKAASKQIKMNGRNYTTFSINFKDVIMSMEMQNT